MRQLSTSRPTKSTIRLSRLTAALVGAFLTTAALAASPRPVAFLSPGPDCDVLLVPHIGGWGDIPLGEADDLKPITQGIEEHLRDRGLNVETIPFHRLPAGPFGRVVVAAELFGVHNRGAWEFARRLERLLVERPDLPVVMVGLSNGAAFGNMTMALLDTAALKRVSSIEIGLPFYSTSFAGPQSLVLDNQGQDPLPAGEMDVLLGNFATALWRVLGEHVLGDGIGFTEALHFSSHDYTWDLIGPDIIRFIDRRLPVVAPAWDLTRPMTGRAD